MPQVGQIINNRNLFLTVLEAGKSKIKALEDLISGLGSPVPGSYTSSMGGELSEVSCPRALRSPSQEISALRA